MNWLITKNLSHAKIDSIPVLMQEIFSEEILLQVNSGKRVVSYFASDKNSSVSIICVLADDINSKVLISSTSLDKNSSYPSLTPLIPSLNLFEREIYEDYGIKPEGHPWLKPVRDGIAADPSQKSKYEFFSMEGDELHEVGVGPIHAGIIEPGHFRFSCHGENVYHLEIQHGFQRRGIERLIEDKNSSLLRKQKIVESIAGDTVVGHTSAFMNAIESFSGISLSRQVEVFRAIALELERIANHIGDLSALSQDIGYLTGASIYGAMRTEIINTTMAMCGNRFGRNLLKIGSINIHSVDLIVKQLKDLLPIFLEKVELASNVLFNASSVLSRFEKTGIVNKETAENIGVVGPAARASNLNIDIRSDHPYGAYRFFPVHIMKLESGDVFARAYIRYIEVIQSINIISDLLLSIDELATRKDEEIKTSENSIVVSLVEGWRGEIAHIALTDSTGEIFRYKIKDPSFNNWTALELAVRNNGISDFPLCNKSFNLSYCGFDL